MSNKYDEHDAENQVDRQAPVLVDLGEAHEVVLGGIGKGLDGWNGESGDAFEFESDDVE